MEEVRVLRIIEYIGERNRVEEVIKKSVHGIKKLKNLKITATTLGEFPEILTTNKLKEPEMFFPEAKKWMWNYCIYLGTYTSSDDTYYDLGINLQLDGTVSAAIVCSNTPGDYISGPLNKQGNSELFTELFTETIKRAITKGIKIR